MILVARTTGKTGSVFLPGMWASCGAAVAAPTATVDFVSCCGEILRRRERDGIAAIAAAATVDFVGDIVLIGAVAVQQRRHRMRRGRGTLLEFCGVFDQIDS